MPKVFIIGIGFRPLDKRAKEIILSSEIILASHRLFEVFRRYEEFEMVKDKVVVINNVDETMNFMKSVITNQKSTVITLFASGDPMFFGIGRRTIQEFGKNTVEILPDISSIQMAFSRIKEPWDDAFLMSLHGGPDPGKRRRPEHELKDIPFLLQKHEKIAILTDRENSPSEIAKALNSSSVIQQMHLKIYVCERLGYPDERVTEGTSSEIEGRSFLTPNVVVIVRKAGIY